MKIVADTYAWVELFIGSARGERARLVIQDSELVLTPGIVLAELARKYIRDGQSQDTVSKRLTDISEASELSQIDPPLALACATAYSELEVRSKGSKTGKPGLTDALILATARVNGAKVLTGDQHFKGLPETVWIGE